jgi:hypothetical protein
MTTDTILDTTADKEDPRRFGRRDPDPDLIRGWPVKEGDSHRELLVRKDAVAWVIAGKGDLEGKTLIGLRTAGTKAIPVSAPYVEVKAWWTGQMKRESHANSGRK